MRCLNKVPIAYKTVLNIFLLNQKVRHPQKENILKNKNEQ